MLGFDGIDLGAQAWSRTNNSEVRSLASIQLAWAKLANRAGIEPSLTTLKGW